MSITAKKDKNYPAIVQVAVSVDRITATMSDGRQVAIPLKWSPKLLNASTTQRSRFEISPGGYGIHWPDVDEDISVKAFLD